jgi:hypothetical protein
MAVNRLAREACRYIVGGNLKAVRKAAADCRMAVRP